MKVAITGASGAIGQQLAQLYAQKGASLYLLGNNHYRQLTTLADDLTARYGVWCIADKVDLSDADAVNAAMARCLGAFGHIDCLINNAAVGLVRPFADTTLADWQRVFAVNLTAPYLLCQAVLPTMARHGGSIVNVSSMWGTLGASCESAYAAAKAGLDAMSKSLAQEYAGYVRVNVLAPGFVDTPMNARLSPAEKQDFFARHPTMRCLTAAEVAQAVVDLADSPQSGVFVKLGW